jgi:hypothetical protein
MFLATFYCAEYALSRTIGPNVFVDIFLIFAAECGRIAPPHNTEMDKPLEQDCLQRAAFH